MGATDKKNSQHEKDGELFYDYEVTGAVSVHNAKHLPLLVLSRLAAGLSARCSHTLQQAKQQLVTDAGDGAGSALSGINHAQEWQSVCSFCQVTNQGKLIDPTAIECRAGQG